MKEKGKTSDYDFSLTSMIVGRPRRKLDGECPESSAYPDKEELQGDYPLGDCYDGQNWPGPGTCHLCHHWVELPAESMSHVR